jgi:hypothetical protein
MQGVIVEEMRLYLANEFGDGAASQILERSGRAADHQYDPDQVYPDSELGLLAVRAAEVTGKPIPEILEGFGEAIVPDMFKYYSILVNPRWSFDDFLLGMEPVLHAALQLHTPGALAPKVQATRTAQDTVRVVYDSPLRACAAVLGIIRGAATHYGVEVNITENECVLRGDPVCVFTVEGNKD